ncbi:MAG: restriction endonuclease subunit S [Pseudomonadota bacterium]
MAAVEALIMDHLDLWTAALKRKSTAGRGSSSKVELYGIKKLRELILELAVRGLLVSQDPNDEPASELLKKIAAEKAKLVKAGTIKKDKLREPIGEDIPFYLPTGWTASPLGELAQVIRGVSYQKQDAQDAAFDSSIPLMRANNINGVLNFRDLVYVPKAIVRAEQLIVRGDLLIAMSSGSADLVGKAAQASQDLDSTFGAFCAVLRPFTEQLFTFMGFFCKTPFYRNQTQATGKGIGIQNLNKTALEMLSVVVPPLAEQHRIVAKVDELMTLCDQLEQETEASLGAHQTLVETLLNALTSAADHTQFASAWQRIAGYFDTLFTTEESIDQLKQTILQLAVMGKLVPQDPNDEDVQVLLRRNDLRRCEVAESDRRADVDPQNILSADDCWEIPASWNWRGLADLVLFVDYRGKTPNKQSSGIRLLTAKNVRQGQIDLMPEEFLTEQEYEEWMTRGLPKVGDVLFTTEAPMGNAAVVELTEQFALAQRVICFQNYGALDPAFLVVQILSNQFQYILDKNGTGMTAKGIKASKLKRLPIAIPPLAEQHRIVAKVDELMAQCDHLKSRLSDAQTTQLHLADALVERAIC